MKMDRLSSLVLILMVVTVSLFPFLMSVNSVEEKTTIKNSSQLEDAAQPQNASTEDLIPVIILLNTDCFVSCSRFSSSSVTPFDVAKHEVASILNTRIHPMGLSTGIESGSGRIKRDLRIINALSADIPPSLQNELVQSKAVKCICPDRKAHLLLENSVALINATPVWQLHDSHGDNVTGKGVVVAVLDSGVDYRHPDLGGGFGTGYKVIGGYDFVNDDPDPMDDDGHGTMMAGILAAEGSVTGVAPGASLLAYKVTNREGVGEESDIIAGIEQAVKDGADIISMSLGLSNLGAYTYNDPLALAIDVAVSEGVTVVAVAGNEGPYISTIETPGCYENVIAVGAVGSGRYIATVDVVSENKTLDATTMLFSPLINVSGELLYAGLGYSENFSNRSFTGKIALIKRGLLWFEEKVKNAYDAGAIGAIIFNNRTENRSEFYSLVNESEIPAVFITQAEGNYLRDLMNQTAVVVSINQTRSIDYESIPLFSSLGPGPGYTIKPNVVAPGTNVNSTALSGSYNASWSGTSLAAPHVAGACALLLQLHPDWTPPYLNAALMNTAQDLGNCPFEQGAGLVDVFKAATTEILAQPASISASTDMYANAVITVQNLRNYPISLNVSVAKEEAINLNFSPANVTTPVIINVTPTVTIGPGESKQVNVSICLPVDLFDLHYCGRIALQSTNSSIAVPFAFRRSSILVDPQSLSIQSAVESIAAGDTVLVAAGNYSETIVVDKPLHIRSLAGPSKTLIAASDSDRPVFEVNANNVTISGFTITGSGSEESVGVLLHWSCFSTISNNGISRNNCGIELQFSDSILMENNTVVNNSDNIHLTFSNNCRISKNSIARGEKGLVLDFSSNNTISNNTVQENEVGMDLSISDGNIIRNNNMIRNTRQVEVFGTNSWDGNYWSDYTGVDNDNDGIGDTPYQVRRGVEDKHPYMLRDGWLNNSATYLVTADTENASKLKNLFLERKALPSNL